VAFGAAASNGVRSGINITPLVDVVLVLLIIFMVLSPTVLKETDLRAPDEAVVQRQPEEEEQIEIRIAGDGSVRLEDAVIGSLAELRVRVRELMSGRDRKVAFFDVDDAASFDRVMTIFDACRGSGVEVLGLIPKPKMSGVAASSSAPAPRPREEP